MTEIPRLAGNGPHRDTYGRVLSAGDCVMRRRKSDCEDVFKCHVASFGYIIDFVEESHSTRPDAPDEFCEFVGETWTEIRVCPFSYAMAPLGGKGEIQWSPIECIRIPRFMYWVLAALWPLTRLIDSGPLNGRSTDW